MKTIEEKAKAYDETIKRAKEWEGNPAAIDYIFPELSEFRNEKVRKALIDFFGKSANYGGQTNGVYDKDILAWLEKQGGYANFRDKAQVGDKVTRNEDGVLVNLSQLERVAKPRGKQGEKKFVVEMKSAEESLGVNSDTYNKIVDECIFGEQKPKENKGNFGGISHNWREEDEAVLDALIRRLKGEDIHVSPHLAVKCLESLKGRVQPKPMCKFGDTELTQEELCEGLIRGMVNEHNRVTKEVLRKEYEKGKDDVLAKIDAIDVDEMVCESGATSRVTQYWYAHGVNDVIKKLKEE